MVRPHDIGPQAKDHDLVYAFNYCGAPTPQIRDPATADLPNAWTQEIMIGSFIACSLKHVLHLCDLAKTGGSGVACGTRRNISKDESLLDWWNTRIHVLYLLYT